MDLNLTEKSVIVSGGASNIGRAITLGFVEEGARVCVADIDEAQASGLADEAPGRIIALATDVTNPESVNAAIAKTIEEFGAVDILVNGAGWTIDRLFVDKPREEWEKEIAIDVWGFINFTRGVLDHMIQRKSGRVVSIGSDAGRIGEWREAVYSGTKAGVIAMSKAIAREVGRYGITLNVVCPGFTPGRPEHSGEHSIWRGEQAGLFTDETLAKVAKYYPLRRLGTPEDIVPVVLLLASERASYVTGQTWSVSGGYTMI
jgi:2-hydroxycyclohexanecarboxyl-CoA dehydrogenase